ncbi:MAG: flavin oxidoreductase/NADH oxidase [Firmicutes bacterium]|nr:flavin oxidoreductase/NADH oxidase [Bacillota bacterium]
MSKHFPYKSADQLAADCRERGLDLSVTEEISLLTEPVAVAERRLDNPLVIQPMEGCDGTADGRPSELTHRRYQRFAAGGAGLIWFEATAITRNGRGNPRQLWLNPHTLDSFSDLVASTRSQATGNPILLLQLTHSGRYSRPVGVRAPVFAFRDPQLDQRTNVTREHVPISDQELTELQQQFVQAAVLAKAAGFDGVDIKACHRYLVSELLAGHTRPGGYGGSLEGRTRFLRETVAAVRQAVGEDFILATRLNVWDAAPWPYGWGVTEGSPEQPELSEARWLAADLSERGVSIINVTAGNPYVLPYIGRPFDKPVIGGALPAEHPLTGVERLLGFAAEIQSEVPEVAVVGTGYSWLRQYFPQVAAAELARGRSRLVGLGRMAFACPDFPLQLAAGELEPGNLCTACSMCTQIMRDGGRTGCVVRDSDVYLSEYRAGHAKA